MGPESNSPQSAAQGQPTYSQPDPDQQTHYQAPPGYPMPGQPPPPQKKGLAITALVLSIVALVLCLIPVINNFAIVLGLVGLGFAIAALVIASKRQQKKGMAIAALIMSVVAIIGAIVSQLIFVAALNSVSDAIEEGSDGVVPLTQEQQSEAAERPALGLGESSAVGDEYNVTVNAVNLDATEDILAVNEFNEGPQGQFVLIDLSVEYTGSEEGDPWIDLGVNFVGSDARQYDSSTCTVLLEKNGSDVPTLENGGKGDYQVCMDVPAEAVQDAQIFVEPTVSFDNDSRVYWAVK
jgi:hypothetical protein